MSTTEELKEEGKVRLHQMTSKELAEELCREQVYTHSTSEEQIKRLENIPALVGAMKSLNGKTTKYFMLDHPDILANVLEEWYEARKKHEIAIRLLRLVTKKPTPEEQALNWKEAAAPDMYEALNDALNTILMMHDMMDVIEEENRQRQIDLKNWTVDKIKSALSKAEGKTENK